MLDDRPRIVAVNFFPAFFPPGSGGEQRYYMLYKHLSEKFDVTLLSATYADRKTETVEHSPSFREVRVPKPSAADDIHWKLVTEGIGPECSALVVALASEFDSEFSERLSRLVGTADVVIHESPFTLPYDKGAGLDNKVRVYNAYNVEYRLAEQMLKGEVGAKASRFIRELEARLISCCSAILATSEEERNAFAVEFGFPIEKIFKAPNGFERTEHNAVAAVPSSGRERSALFLGSAHPPNIEAVEFIAGRLAPALPDVRFRVIGSVCKAYKGEVPANVELLGFVAEAEKSQLLRNSGVAINPLSSGAGTNLKMLDYMAHGAPIVSTPIGARGLEMQHGVHARIVELEGFAAELQSVLTEPEASDDMASEAAALADRKYAWSAIAEDVAAVLNRVLDREDVAQSRPRVVMVCDYEVHQARGGGQVRVKELLTELGREFDVTLLCFGTGDDERRMILAPGVVQRSFPKSKKHRDHEIECSRNEFVSVADLLAAEHCLENKAFAAAFRHEIGAAALVMFEQCFLAPLLAYVPDELPVVYSSQNVETTLKERLLAVRKDGPAWIELTRELEARLAGRADLLICVSESDRQVLSAQHGKDNTVVIENGVRLPRIRRVCGADSDDSAPRTPLAVFVGSAHPPNVQAAEFIIDHIANQHPNVLFALVGSVCEAINVDGVPPNVRLLGFLDADEKEALFSMADVAVNPLFEGGGSSLKVPDFLAAGLPLLSSSVGVRGFPGLHPGEHYEAVEPKEMAGHITALLKDKARRTRLSVQAMDYVATRLDWRVLGGKLRKCLRKLIPRQGRRRALILTYRFGEPPRGGAETFLLNVLKRLSKDDRLEFDVAVPAIGAIRDHLHFSADFDPPAPDRDAVPEVGRQVFVFDADPPLEDRFQDAVALHAMWMRESVALGARLANVLEEGLLGGWNYPEQNETGLVRWAGPIAQVRVPKGAVKLRMTGFAPAANSVAIFVNNVQVDNVRISGRFSIRVSLNPNASIVEFQTSGKVTGEGDPRELAYLAESIVFTRDGADLPVDLEKSMEDTMRQLHPERWVDELIALTQSRPRDLDNRFSRIRGPHSESMERWLAHRCMDYDLILAQGVPFATSVLAARVAAHNGLPLVLLPHFHMEDRYYHWRQFYDAFQMADRVIAAPAASKPLFFDRIGADSVVLAGGGFDSGDFTEASLAGGREAFRRLHTSDRPYVLVLGRKAAAKNYMTIVEACRRLTVEGTPVDVVLVGPDDDGAPLEGEGVYYYGPQPREVVIGALAESLCLANMSESESFGIVLLESWMAKRPVIARASTLAFTELVREGENGHLAESMDDVMAGIRAYLADETLARRHAAAGQATAMGFDWNELTARILQTMLEVVGDGS